MKMTVLYVEKTTSRSMLEIGENTKSSLPMDLLGCMHKLAKETHRISEVRTCNNQVNKLPHKSAIGMNIDKYWRGRVPKFRLPINGRCARLTP